MNVTPERLAQLEQIGTKRGEGLAMIAVHVELCTAVRTLMDERNRIVADTRRQIAEEIEATFAANARSELDRPKVERGGFLNDREWAAAIARGSGGDETARQE
jgi:hypothetical protein